MAKRKEFQEEPYDIFQASTAAISAAPLLSSAQEEKVRVIEVKTGTDEKTTAKQKAREPVNQTLPYEVSSTPHILPESKVKHSLVLESAEQENEYQAFESRLRQRFGSAVTFSVLGRALFTA